MRVEILRPVMISGESAPAGSFVEVSLTDANTLISANKAVAAPAVAEAAPEEVVEPSPAKPPVRASRKSAPAPSPEPEA